MTQKVKRHMLRAVAAVITAVVTFTTMASLHSVPTRAATAAELQQQLAQLEKEEKKLKEELASYKNDVKKQQQYSDSIKQKIKNSISQIDLLQEQIDLLNLEMDEKTNEIKSRENEVVQAQQEIDDKMVLFSERLRVISQTGNMSALQMIFNTDEYVDYLLKENVVERIAQNDQRMIDELNAQIEKLKAEKVALENEKLTLEADRLAIEEIKKEADAKKAELDALYAESNAVLKKLQNSVSSVNKDLAAKKKQEAALEAQIKNLLSGSSSKGQYSGGTMFWPVPAVRNISSGFGPRWGTTHRGIDIANGSVPVYGQNVVAAADGTVISAFPNGSSGGYGLFIMVDHGRDSSGRRIVTLYAHLSAVLVRVGDTVTGGTTVLGRAGASGDVQGPHLHFEVRVDGTAVDPIKNGYVSR